MNAPLSYRETAVRGASPLQLVVLLYHQVLQDLYRALAALEQENIEARTRAINHAISVIGHLHATLDMDRGGEVARNLARFYSALRQGLMEAQRRQSADLLKEHISHLASVHDAWVEVERASAAPASSQTPAPVASGQSRTKSGWSA
jgi:flagellar protein FliS